MNKEKRVLKNYEVSLYDLYGQKKRKIFFNTSNKNNLVMQEQYLSENFFLLFDRDVSLLR